MYHRIQQQAAFIEFAACRFEEAHDLFKSSEVDLREVIQSLHVWHIINPLSPHDALKHPFTFLKTYLIFLQLRVLEHKFP